MRLPCEILRGVLWNLQRFRGAEAGQVFGADVSVATIGHGDGDLVSISSSKNHDSTLDWKSWEHPLRWRTSEARTAPTSTDSALTAHTFQNAPARRPIRVGDTTLRYDGLAPTTWDSGADTEYSRPAPQDQATLVDPGHRPFCCGSASARPGLAADTELWQRRDTGRHCYTGHAYAGNVLHGPPEAISTVRAAGASQQLDPQATSQAQQTGSQGQTAVGSGQAPAA